MAGFHCMTLYDLGDFLLCDVTESWPRKSFIVSCRIPHAVASLFRKLHTKLLFGPISGNIH